MTINNNHEFYALDTAYQEKHKEKITIWKRSLWYCSACDCDVQKNNKAQHLKTKKHINNTNK